MLELCPSIINAVPGPLSNIYHSWLNKKWDKGGRTGLLGMSSQVGMWVLHLSRETPSWGLLDKKMYFVSFCLTNYLQVTTLTILYIIHTILQTSSKWNVNLYVDFFSFGLFSEEFSPDQIPCKTFFCADSDANLSLMIR